MFETNFFHLDYVEKLELKILTEHNYGIAQLKIFDTLKH